MASQRTPFQGVANIIQFNWHFFLLSGLSLLGMWVLAIWVFPDYRLFIYLLISLGAASTLLSLLVSYYVYDLSGLYELKWLDELTVKKGARIVNIHAGFDETSSLISEKFPEASLSVLDFYNPQKHTEVSIKRARKAYPPYPGTYSTSTSALPMEDSSIQAIFAIFSAHEVRDEKERIEFFQELYRILETDGQLILTEHLRDLPNFLAYNIGFLHFHSLKSWKKTLLASGFQIKKQSSFTPFIQTFILEKNGNSL